MSNWNLLKQYLLALVKTWYVTVTLILEVIGLLLLIGGVNINIPVWLYPATFGAVFFVANFLLYRDGREEVVTLVKKYEGDIQQLQDKIAELENRQPRLRLFFQVDGRVTRHQILNVLPIPDEPDIEELVKQQSAKLEPLYEEEEQQTPPFDSAESNNLLQIERAMRSLRRNLQALGRELKSPEEYQEACEEYLRQYRNYLKRLHSHKTYLARFREIRFAVKNEGNVPAEEIVVVTHFPDVFDFPITEDEQLELLYVQEPPKPPTHPSRFRSHPFMSLPSFNDFIVPPGDPFPGIDLPSNVHGPHIEPTNSVEVTYEIDHLLHNFTEKDFDPVGFYISDAALGHTWEIKYSIHAANLPKPIHGSLTLEVQEMRE